MIAFASSLDQGGVFTRSVEDAALLLGEMSGFDENDSTSVDVPVPDYLGGINKSIKGLKIGFSPTTFLMLVWMMIMPKPLGRLLIY